MFQDIEDVVAFVKWLDDELCFLVSQLLTFSNLHLRRVLIKMHNCIKCGRGDLLRNWFSTTTLIYYLLTKKLSSQLLIMNYEFESIGYK